MIWITAGKAVRAAVIGVNQDLLIRFQQRIQQQCLGISSQNPL